MPNDREYRCDVCGNTLPWEKAATVVQGSKGPVELRCQPTCCNRMEMAQVRLDVPGVAPEPSA